MLESLIRSCGFPIPPPIPPEFWLLLVGVILSSLFGWSIPSITGWVRARTKRKESVKEYDDIIKRLSNTLDQKSLDTINNQVISAYTNEKISEFQYKILDKKISEYYDKIKDKSNSEIGKSSNKRSPI